MRRALKEFPSMDKGVVADEFADLDVRTVRTRRAGSACTCPCVSFQIRSAAPVL